MTAFKALTLSRTSTPQQVVVELKDMIMRGDLAPGERINESTIAAAWGLSRNTVREALRLLESGGLIRRHPRRGMAVWDPSDDEILDLYSARYYLETLAASTVTPATDLSEIRAALEEFKSVLETHDPHQIMVKDLKIHAAVVGLLRNDFLNNTYAHLSTQLQYFLMVLSHEHHEYEDVADIEREHSAIVDALESRDPRRAAEVVGDITIRSRDHVRRAIQRRRETTVSVDGR
ncbi:GntR family transcriptional regulator [Mycolicibacterium litorale]|uniref:GntR family transcriptional regulator n=1 Tax=Mycolicibacterium litorale TaxID=758802 RepID=UPI003CF770C8